MGRFGFVTPGLAIAVLGLSVPSPGAAAVDPAVDTQSFDHWSGDSPSLFLYTTEPGNLGPRVDTSSFDDPATGLPALYVFNNLKATADSDGDGFQDTLDNCPNIANPTQQDRDGDLVGDVCDADRDGDGIDNPFDVFPDDSAEWTDADGDGVGDNADAFPNDSTEWSDFDQDGYGDNGDAFPYDSSEHLDTDHDGIGNNADDDDDGDGLDDVLEFLMGTNPLDPDTDGDGLSDLEESVAGTDPLDPNDPAQVPLAGPLGTLGLVFALGALAVLRLVRRR